MFIAARTRIHTNATLVGLGKRLCAFGTHTLSLSFSPSRTGTIRSCAGGLDGGHPDMHARMRTHTQEAQALTVDRCLGMCPSTARKYTHTLSVCLAHIHARTHARTHTHTHTHTQDLPALTLVGLQKSDMIKERLFMTVLDYDLSSAPDLLGIYVRSQEAGVTLQELNSYPLGTR
jgi:hypothetical protein